MRSIDAEDIVTSKLEAHGLRCKRFAKAEMRAGKTPDRRVFEGDQFAFFLEVKEIEDVVTHGLGDSILDRIATRIHYAVKQFDSVNPDREHPNVLAFVNRNRMCGSLDLIEVVTGHRLLEHAAPAATGLRWSEGRIREEKWRLDLYLWFDSHMANQIFFNDEDQRYRKRLAGYLAINPSSIGHLA